MPAALAITTRTAPPQKLVVSRTGTRSSIAALAFLEGVAQLGTIESLRAWFDGEVGPNGWAPDWTAVSEPEHEPLALQPSPDKAALRALLRDARANVVQALRGLLWAPGDEAWLGELVASGCVLPAAQAKGASPKESREYVAVVPAGRPLSELVLALLGADILARRKLYDDRLCVCSVCGSVTFAPETTGRFGCIQHPTRPREPDPEPDPDVPSKFYR